MTFQEFSDVPHLATALTGPLQTLERVFLDRQVDIEAWFRERWRATPPPITTSVDLRNAGFKLAPVDTNLFPAGFNNLSPDFLPLAIQAAQITLEQLHPGIKRLLLIPENHTRNMHYFENIAKLRDILESAGFNVRLGSLIPDLKKTTLELPSGQQITLEPIVRQDDQLMLENYTPCLIILNNDLSDGIPELLNNIKQPILPALKLGWSTRLKSQHFTHYQRIAKEFSELLALDPWFIDPYFDICDDVDFVTRTGEGCVSHKVDALLQKIQKKYDEHGITQKPFVVVKADAGSYGMGVMNVRSGEEILQLNRKQRVKMASTKGQKVNRVIIQEGVYTFETMGEKHAVAEPVVYLLGRFVIGGFYRIHTERGVDENLNAPGMHFEPLAFESCCTPPMGCQKVPNRFYAYGVIARLAALAAASEALEVK